MYVEKITKEVIKDFKERACCLIPKDWSKFDGITCHEYDFCGCEVLALIKEIEQLKGVEAIAKPIAEMSVYSGKDIFTVCEAIVGAKRLEQQNGLLKIKITSIERQIKFLKRR